MIWVLTVAALVAAMLGGIFFSFSTFVMQGLGDAGDAGWRAMRDINRRVYGSAFLAVFTLFGVACLGLLGFGLWRGDLWAVTGALAYLAGLIGMTMFVHVPMNNRLDRSDAAYWPDYHARWTRLNHIRTAACFLSAGAFLIAGLSLGA